MLFNYTIFSFYSFQNDIFKAMGFNSANQLDYLNFISGTNLKNLNVAKLVFIFNFKHFFDFFSYFTNICNGYSFFDKNAIEGSYYEITTYLCGLEF